MAKVKFRYTRQVEYEAEVELRDWTAEDVENAGDHDLADGLFYALGDREGEYVGESDADLVRDSVACLPDAGE